MARISIGRRVRDRRQDLGLTQAALAGRLGISAPYLNLIEHDKRTIGGRLLRRLAAELKLDLDRVDGAEDQRVLQDLLEILRAHGLGSTDPEDGARLVSRHPDFARAMLTLHRLYKDASETARALSDRLSQDPTLMHLSHQILTEITSIRSFAGILRQYGDLTDEQRLRFTTIIAAQSDALGDSARAMVATLGGTVDDPRPASPADEVDDLLIDRAYHFPELEEAADTLRRRLYATAGAPADDLDGAIALFRRRYHGPLEATADAESPESPSSRRFRHARRLVLAEMSGVLDRLTADGRLTSDEARNRARHALGAYGAAALLYPYDPFLAAAEDCRYDLEILARRFGASLEQVAHRLVSLRAPGREGVPFAMLRADPAGTISKRFSLPGLRMPRFGAACPLWAAYRAFAEPDRMVVQLAAMPDGARFLFIARRLVRPAPGFGRTPALFSLMLGCDVLHAHRVVYGDAVMAGERGESEALPPQATPTGFDCRSCVRESCDQRAHARVGATVAGGHLF